MSKPSFQFDSDRDAYVIDGPADEGRFRLIVPSDFVSDEVGADASESDRLTWLRANLPQILQAYTARTGGGRVKEPWNRVLVEEVD